MIKFSDSLLSMRTNLDQYPRLECSLRLIIDTTGYAITTPRMAPWSRRCSLQELKATRSSPATLVNVPFIFVAFFFLDSHAVLIVICLSSYYGRRGINGTASRRCVMILSGARVGVLVWVVIWLLRGVSELRVSGVRTFRCGIGIGTSVCFFDQTPHTG